MEASTSPPSPSQSRTWVVQPDAYTRRVAPDWDGQSSHYMAKLPPIDWSQIPEGFKIGVVFGPSGSGKTTLAHMLAAHASPASIGKATEEVFQKDLAVVSHPGFNADALNRLSAVGLNKIPSWCRPYHVLSNGEQSRVRTALSLCQGALLDDFAQVVDEANANSMAASLVKLARSKGYMQIVISTTKSCVLPFLQPDFILLTKSGKIVLNPYPEGQRAPKVLWNFKISGYSSDAGWQSNLDDVDDGKSCETFVGGESLPNVLWDKSLEVCVKMDDAVGEACHAFDYEFTGTSNTTIKCVDVERLQQSVPGFKLAAILGPSGSGKSHCLKNVGAEIKDNFEWDRAKSVISQLTTQDSDVAAELCAAVALPLQTALRPFHVLSEGEQHRASMARQLDVSLDASGSSAVGLDEFTSVLDRRLAKMVCSGINEFLQRHPSCRPVIVATVHQDIAKNLQAQWILDTDRGRMLKMPLPKLFVNRGLSFRLSQTDGDEDEMKQLLKPPVVKLMIRKLRGNKHSISVFNDFFEQHHYMKGKVPSTFAGVVVRNEETDALVAFHAIAPQFGANVGKISMRESRLVVVPEFQGFGIGPQLSDRIGQILIDSGRCLYSVTHHPRLGGYRERSMLWKASIGNGKATTFSLSGKKVAKPRESFRHMFLGTSEDGNRQLALDSCDVSAVGLLKRPGKIFAIPSARPSGKMLETIRRAHGKTPKQFLLHVKRTDGEEAAKKMRKWLESNLASGRNIELRQTEDDSAAPEKLGACSEKAAEGQSDSEFGIADKEEPQSLDSLGLRLNLSESEATEKETLQNLNPSVTSCLTPSDLAVETCEANCGESDEAETPKRAQSSKVEIQKTGRKRRWSDNVTTPPDDAVLASTGKKAKLEYINSRLEQVQGKTVAEACDGSVTFTRNGELCVYKRCDVKYDVARGLLEASVGSAKDVTSQADLGCPLSGSSGDGDIVGDID